MIRLAGAAKRIDRHALEIQRNDIALKALRKGMDPKLVAELLDLSPSALERLAGQLRGMQG